MRVVSKTPLRISFVGGMTDISWFYREHGGCVISTAIDKYITVKVMGRRGSAIDLRFGMVHRLFDSVDKIEHPIVRECLRRAGITGIICDRARGNVV